MVNAKHWIILQQATWNIFYESKNEILLAVIMVSHQTIADTKHKKYIF